MNEVLGKEEVLNSADSIADFEENPGRSELYSVAMMTVPMAVFVELVIDVAEDDLYSKIIPFTSYCSKFAASCDNQERC